MSTPWIVAFVCLWIVVAGLALVVAGVLRRVNTVLGTLPAQGAAADLRSGPQVGSRLPDTPVLTMSGQTIALAELDGPLVLAVLSGHCGPCVTIAEWLRAHPDRISVASRLMVLTEAESDGIGDLPDGVEVLTDTNGVAIGALDLPGTPFVVTVGESRAVRSSSLLSGPEALLRTVDGLTSDGAASGHLASPRVVDQVR